MIWKEGKLPVEWMDAAAYPIYKRAISWIVAIMVASRLSITYASCSPVEHRAALNDLHCWRFSAFDFTWRQLINDTSTAMISGWKLLRYEPLGIPRPWRLSPVLLGKSPVHPLVACGRSISTCAPGSQFVRATADTAGATPHSYTSPQRPVLSTCSGSRTKFHYRRVKPIWRSI